MDTETSGNTIPKTFQEEVADAIRSGDLAKFKKCCVGKNDINRRLMPTKDLKPKPKINKNERYISLKGPTMVMFCILCEQSEILEYILLEKSPDLSIKVEGYNCVHLAAMVKDPKCLQLLLREEWVQQNITTPIDLQGTQQVEGQFTTVLHAAVTNKRLANTFLLLTEFPPIRENKKGKKVEGEGEGEDEPEEPKAQYSGASLIDQKATSGSTPLYIAVYLQNYPLVRILLCLGADPTISCLSVLDEKSNKPPKKPIDLALERQQQNNERKQKMKEQLEGKVKKGLFDEESDIDKIVNLLKAFDESGTPDTPQLLMHEYCPELEEHVDEEEEDNDEPEQQDEEKTESPKTDSQPTQQETPKQNEPSESADQSSKPVRKPKARPAPQVDNSILAQILEKVSQIDKRLQLLENQRGMSTTAPGPNMTNVQPTTECCVCHTSDAILCPTCHKYYCQTCMRKEHIHQCTAP